MLLKSIVKRHQHLLKADINGMKRHMRKQPNLVAETQNVAQELLRHYPH
jgi:hypothetical protein